MSDLTTYRITAIEAVELLFEMDVLTDHEYGFSAEDVVDVVLKADSRLQAIADAYADESLHISGDMTTDLYRDMPRTMAALGALTEDNDE